MEESAQLINLCNQEFICESLFVFLRNADLPSVFMKENRQNNTKFPRRQRRNTHITQQEVHQY